MTLVEVVIAMAIFGMIMVAIFPALLVLNRTNILSEEDVSSNYIAQDLTETMYNYSQTIDEGVFVSYLISDNGFTLTSHSGTTYLLTKSSSDYDIDLVVKFDTPAAEFVTTLVQVSSNNSVIEGQMSQIETILSFGN
ncbi:hypothetical protein SDC9_158955 [bioreactor metagenome]|uniref:Prepilin-type N-terminal cleavage/methylation domain-containing protein n=1 Tax=bioreactor metagenome TaxID=1076179 RepID=A0A645FBG5_9ZZZZ